MSSLKRAQKMAGQREHRERAQPGSRAKLGLLEKKKDYQLRARDYNKKKEELHKLRRLAQNKNPDEFHYHMINSHMGFDGVHRELSPESDDETELQKKLGDLRNLQYVKHKLQVERKKIEKLKATLHMTDMARQNTHTIFVDDDDDAKTFDAAKYFDTPKELLGRSFSRPKTETLQRNSVSALSKAEVLEAEKLRKKQYSELVKRIEREKELTIVVEKMEVKKNLQASTGAELQPKLVKKGTTTKAAVFEWQYERKK
uniref:U3 small nucleolar RNA-associated protein 11 n=1 Tax=Steinernema glaseri TaxID=37863 RepID=A0A1I7Z267_9BILA